MRTNRDSFRGAIGGLAALVAVALAISPWPPGQASREMTLLIVSSLIVTGCIWTAKSKAGVALGILAIVVFRFIVAGAFIAIGAFHGG